MRHQELIYRIKSKLSLQKLQSTFVSRSNILRYVNILDEENKIIRATLYPVSEEQEMRELEEEYQRKIQGLSQLQLEQSITRSKVSKVVGEIECSKKEIQKNNIIISGKSRAINTNNSFHVLREDEYNNNEIMEDMIKKFNSYFNTDGQSDKHSFSEPQGQNRYD